MTTEGAVESRLGTQGGGPGPAGAALEGLGHEVTLALDPGGGLGTQKK